MEQTHVKQLVKELKCRRVKEPNLVIQDGIIINTKTHLLNQMDANTSASTGYQYNSS